MKFHLIVLIIAMVCRVQSLLHRNSGSTTDKQRCEKTCEKCFANQDSLERMGCLEKCIRQGVNRFTCPGSQTFLGVVDMVSPGLKEEIENFFAMRSDMYRTGDIAGVVATYTANSFVIIDGQKPVVGRADREKQLRDFFTANPDIDHHDTALVAYGEENGIIWANGIYTNHANSDKQNKVVSVVRFMSLLTRVGAELQEFSVVFFKL
ncbi:uncharacterized protein [Amphiura filiformis]|uniref:uncharacterized protein isoform X1 n=1 Tax=Amphiura filiformis TaxID=82378 RepID=UPI003B21977D